MTECRRKEYRDQLPEKPRHCVPGRPPEAPAHSFRCAVLIAHNQYYVKCNGIPEVNLRADGGASVYSAGPGVRDQVVPGTGVEPVRPVRAGGFYVPP